MAARLRDKRLTAARHKGKHTLQEWRQMVTFFGCCVICGRSDPIEKDHIRPLYQGGSDHISNIQPICPWCNSSKGPNSDDFRKSFCELRGLQMPKGWLPSDR